MKKPFLGFGLGLRARHFEHVLREQPKVDWFEILSENFMVDGGKTRYYLKAIRERYPMAMHGVSLSIGSTDPLDMEYLAKLKQLARDVEPCWISDHLCWTSSDGVQGHDLLPLPYTGEVIDHVVRRVSQVQDFLGQQILLENVSSYLTFRDSEMTEWDFYSEIVARADCLMLFDVNNIYVSGHNHGFNPFDYLAAINPGRVQQIHLAGHRDCGNCLVDTHDRAVCDPVWELYREAIRLFGPISSMIERDDNIPDFAELEAELDMARAIAREVIPDQQFSL